MARKPSGLKHLKVIAREELPGRTRRSILNGLPLWDDMKQIAEAVKKTGSTPFEGYAEIHVADYPELKKLKQPLPSLVSKIRQFLRKYRIDGQLELISRKDKGSIYIGGSE